MIRIPRVALSLSRGTKRTALLTSSLSSTFSSSSSLGSSSSWVQVAPVLSSSLRSAASVGKVRWFGDAAGGMETEGEPFLDPAVVTERVVEVVKSFEKVDANKVSGESRFKEDLDLDSLDAVEIVLQLEEEFSIQIPDSEADNILTIPDAVKYISGHPMAR